MDQELVGQELEDMRETYRLIFHELWPKIAAFYQSPEARSVWRALTMGIEDSTSEEELQILVRDLEDEIGIPTRFPNIPDVHERHRRWVEGSRPKF